MTQNPQLHVFSANGYYDFATPFFATQYTLHHLNLDRADSRTTSLRLLRIGPHGLFESIARSRNSKPISRAGTTARWDVRRDDDEYHRSYHRRRRSSPRCCWRRRPRTNRPYVPPAARRGNAPRLRTVGGQSDSLHGARRHDHAAQRQGQITARMFYTAFTKDGAELRHRPVTFFYNGGPGSSTIWLRMGSFAPMRVQTSERQRDPERAVQTDREQVQPDRQDAIWSSSTRRIPVTAASSARGKPKDFMGVDQDGRAFTQFIQRYITQFGRWNSPKFLFGESYGTTRDCVLVNMLQEAGVQMNGVVLLVLDPEFRSWRAGRRQSDRRRRLGLRDLPSDRSRDRVVPSQSRCNGQCVCTAFLKSVEAYAGGQYLHDLAQGFGLEPGAVRKRRRASCTSTSVSRGHTSATRTCAFRTAVLEANCCAIKTASSDVTTRAI